MLIYPSNPVVTDSMIFEDAPWELYEVILKSYDETPSRISYSNGRMEIAMTLSMEHEGLKAFLGAMVDALLQVWRIRAARRGSATLKRDEQRKGLEADLCYWIQHYEQMRVVKRLDLNIHPPPDLVVEIDVTHSTVDREDIYQSLGVPEMWHYSTKSRLTAWHNDGQRWSRIEHSKAIPALRVDDLNPFVDRFVAGDDENVIIEDFRRWLSETRPR
jgi:Uma2 family endonuclease